MDKLNRFMRDCKESFRKIESSVFGLMLHVMFFIPLVLIKLVKFGHLLLTSIKGTLYLLGFFAISVAIATFVENDFGTPTTRAEIYNAKWFEILLIVTTINLIYIFFKFKMHRFKKWHVSLFHLSFVIIGIGALATRYLGYEGTMTIREGQTSNLMTSETTYISTEVFKNGQKLYSSLDPIAFSKLEIFHSNDFKKVVDLNGEKLNIELTQFMPYFDTKYVYSPFGEGIINILVLPAGSQNPINVTLKEGEYRDLGMAVIEFGTKEFFSKPTISIFKENEKLKIQALSDVTFVSMDNFNERITDESGKKLKFEMRKLYSIDGFNIVLKDFQPYAIEEAFSNEKLSKQQRDMLPNGLKMEVSLNDSLEEKFVIGSDNSLGEKTIFNLNGYKVQISYGAQIIELPFYLKLRDFELQRYSGSMSASSYASEITLIDQKNDYSKDYRIFMNNVLDYQGFRFFQSSYTQDEQGTILSVNFDEVGTNITYIGYFLMMLGMVFAIFGKNGRFQILRRKLIEKSEKRGKKIKYTANSVIFIFATLFVLFNPSESFADTNTNNQNIPAQDTSSIEDIFKFEKHHSSIFGHLLVQSANGRIKPLDTMNIEIVTKLTKKKNLFGLTANQVVLGMMLRPDLWKQLKIISVKHPKVKEILGVSKEDKAVAFEQFFEDSSSFEGYKLEKYVSEAMQTAPKKRGTFEKEIVKVDERVNIAFMIFTGSLLKVFPNPDEEQSKLSNNAWVSPVEAIRNFNPNDAQLVQSLLITYFSSIDEALTSGNWKKADKNLNNLIAFQQKYGSAVFPPESKIKAEIIYNQLNIFEKGIPLYFGLGFIILILGFIALFSEKYNFRTINFVLASSLMFLFLIYSIGLGLRWYISGHAPWSDAYESLLYIGWATILAGFIFSKNSPITLGTTTILTGLILFVAHLSFIDPQITNLVPVLKSYWLTIHVSLITASYGFLGLGSILGFMTLILFATKNLSTDRRPKIEATILELNIINEMNLIIGLFLLTIGNFLGGVWANESWGRYWGWDSKETWSLITILIYAMVLHVRFIPKLSTAFNYSFFSLIAFSSVIMTYFGVNFYLSGLHSYAQGDPVPIPSFVYYTIAIISVLSVIAYRNRKLEIKG